jgi:hypothetical protein
VVGVEHDHLDVVSLGQLEQPALGLRCGRCVLQLEVADGHAVAPGKHDEILNFCHKLAAAIHIAFAAWAGKEPCDTLELLGTRIEDFEQVCAHAAPRIGAQTIRLRQNVSRFSLVQFQR